MNTRTRRRFPHEHQILVFIDLNDTLSDVQSALQAARQRYPGLSAPQSEPGFYRELAPMPGAVDAFHSINGHDSIAVYILAASEGLPPHAYAEQRCWVERHLGPAAAQRLIFCPNKALLLGHVLVDDRLTGEGQELFNGELLQFGSTRYPNWLVMSQQF